MEKVVVEFEECVVVINCVIKVVKGGCCFFFVVLVVVGNKFGEVGFGFGKVGEVFEVIGKVSCFVKKFLVLMVLKDGRIIFYEVIGKFGVVKVVMKLVVLGIGVIVGGVVCVVFEFVGIKDILIKCVGIRNLYNVVRVIIDGLK